MASHIAFLYPGQGSQQPGMGVELLQDDEVSALCDQCASAANIDLRGLLTTASDDELRAFPPVSVWPARWDAVPTAPTPRPSSHVERE